MRKLPIDERIVEVLTNCCHNPESWSAELRADCALIHARFEALKLDISTSDAWRQAQQDWIRKVIKQSGLVRVTYHFRDCPQPSI